MLKILSLIAVIAAAVAGPASAEGIAVKVKGRPTTVVKAEINQAARQVCKTAIKTDPFDYDTVDRCVFDSASAALMVLRTAPQHEEVERIAANQSGGQ